MDPKSDRRRRRRGDSYPMNDAWLYRQAVHYLERWESTEAGVRRVLQRRIRRRCARTGEDEASPIDGIAAVIQKLVGLDYVDDQRFCEQLGRRLRHQGHSRAVIRSRMRSKGVPDAIIEEFVREDDDGNDLRAAWIVARKRRLGPFRTSPISDEFDLRRRERQRELAILGRRGFSFDVARQVLESTDPPLDLR